MIRVLRLAGIVLCIASMLLYGGVSIYTKISADYEGPEISMTEKEITVSTKDGEEGILSESGQQIKKTEMYQSFL